jgi:hypothetical protein
VSAGCGSVRSGHRPSGHRPSGHRPRFRKQQRTVRRPRCPVPQLPGHRPPCPAARPAADPHPVVPAPRQRRAGCALSSTLVTWARSTQPMDTGCPEARTPEVACRTPGARTPPALRTPATAAASYGHCGSGHAGQPAAEASTTVAMSDRNGTARCGTGQHPCLTARSVAWCSASTAVMVSAVCAPQVESRVQPVTKCVVGCLLVDCHGDYHKRNGAGGLPAATPLAPHWVSGHARAGAG